MNKKCSLFCCAVLMAGSALFAQNKSDSLIMRDLLLEKDYSPQIENAGKIYQMPGTEEIKTNKQAVKFATSGNLIALDKELVPMQAADAKIDFPDQDKWGYARLGWQGLYLQADAQANILHQERQRLSFNLRGHAQSDNYHYPYEDINNQIGKAQIDYQYHFNRFAVNASLSECFQSWEPSLGRTNTSDSKISVGIASKPWGNDFNYNMKADAHLFYLNRLGAQHLERELDLNADFSYQITEEWLASLALDMKNFGYGKNSALQEVLWFDIQPKVSYRWRLWDFDLGAHLSDIVGKESSFKVAAIASASRSLGEKAAFQLKLDGDQQVYSYREGFEMNPYLNLDERIMALHSPIHLNGNIVWNPLDALQVRAQGGYRYTKNLANFVADQNEFHLNYLNTNILYLGGGLDFRYGKMLRLSGDVQYRHYDKEVFYRPALTIDAALEIRPMEKLSLSANYHAALQRLQADDYHYWQACATYAVAKSWEVFLQWQDLVDPNFSYWSCQYKPHYFIPILGASYSF